MLKCYKITIWRIYVIDVAKFWPKVVKEAGYNINELSEKAFEALDFIISKYSDELFLKLVQKLKSKYNEKLADELLEIERTLEEVGNFNNEVVQSVGFTFYVTEQLSGLFSYLPPALEELVINDDNFRRNKKFGEFLNKPLASVINEDNSFEITYGIIVKEETDEVLCSMVIE